MTEQQLEEVREGTVVTGPWAPAVEAVEVPPFASTAVQGEVLPASPVLPPRARIGDPIRLPAWVTSRTVARATARHTGRVAARVSVRSTWRAPAAVARGTWRAGRFWWSWVRAEDLAGELRDTDSGKLGREVLVVRDHRKVRWYITGGTLATTGVAEAVAAAMVGDWVPALTGVAAVGAAGIAGRHRPTPDGPSTWTVQPDNRVSLAPEHLNAAFRAAGLLKGPDASLVLCAPIVRDRLDRGWDTMVDLPRVGGKPPPMRSGSFRRSPPSWASTKSNC